MMRQMREMTKPIMLFTAIAFAALMVFQWGMDITGRGGGAVGEIGRVNGDPVMYEAYMAAYRNLYDQVQRDQEEPVTSQQNKEIEDAAFNDVVNQLLIRQELDRRGITVTDREIGEAAQFSPPEYLRPEFVDENGRFDVGAYQTFLATQTQDFLLLLEAYYRDVIPRGKLFRQVSTGLYLSDADLWRRWKDQDELVEIRFVSLDPRTRYQDVDFEISESEISEYYDAHQEEFAVPARATVKVVVLDKTPTAADTVASYEKAVRIRQDILEGADFADVATRESADRGSAPRGGDLGVFPKGFMDSALDSAVFASRPGTLTDPVTTPFGYQVIEVQERWGQDSAQARNILVSVARTDDSEIELLTLADSIEDMGESMSLDAVGAAAGVTVSTVDITESFPFVAVAGQISEGADWAFEEAAPGEVSPVFENAQAFYSLELVSSAPEGVLPLEDAAPAIESTLRFDRQMERARADGQAIVDRIRAGEALVNVAADLGLDVRTPEAFTRNAFVPGLGRQNTAIGAAFGLEPGQVSGVVSTPANAFIIEVMGRSVADSTAWRGQLLTQRSSAAAILQQRRLQEWIVALRASAKIVDRRDVVLQPVDDDFASSQLPMVF